MRKRFAAMVFGGLLLGACGSPAPVPTETAGETSAEIDTLAFEDGEESESSPAGNVGSASEETLEFAALEFEGSDIVASLERLSDVGLVVEHRVSGKANETSYNTRETVTVASDGSTVSVSLDATELGDLYDELIPEVLQAQQDAGVESQSIGVTLLLVQGLAQDRAEYVVVDDARLTTARTAPLLSQRLDALIELTEEHPQSAQTAVEDFIESLDQVWMESPIRENEQPHFLGHGHILPDVISSQLVEIGVDETFQVTEREANSDGVTIIGETQNGTQIVFEFDEESRIREIAFDQTSPWLGSIESHVVSIRETGPDDSVDLPSEDVLITEEEISDQLLALAFEHFPELVEENRQAPVESEFQTIDGELSRGS